MGFPFQVSAVDGVLEIVEEHFWSQVPGQIIASLRVRARRDAVEQVGPGRCRVLRTHNSEASHYATLVAQNLLKRIQNIFSRSVAHLSVEIEKDPPLNWVPEC